MTRHQPHSYDGSGPGLPGVTRSVMASLALPGGGRPYDPGCGRHRCDDALGLPADLPQPQRESDEARRKLARWPPAISRPGGDEQWVIDMLWARQPQLSATVAKHLYFSGRDAYGRVKAHPALQRANQAPGMSARAAASPGAAVTGSA
jgi:hypothetical protein